MGMSRHPLMKKAIEARIQIFEIFDRYDKADQERARLRELSPEDPF